MTVPLSFGYTPDPDDAFHYFALQHGLVPLTDEDGRSLAAEFVTGHVHRLNQMATKEKLDVTAISSAFYPLIDDRYVVLGSGTSVGRGYGPVLCCRRGERPASLAGRRVAVPGTSTTGAFLLHYFHEGMTVASMDFDEIAEAVVSGQADAGVLIHEELLHHAESGVEKMECLGTRWLEETGLPLPVGLVVARRELGEPLLRQIRGALEASMLFALENRAEALAFARQFGRGDASSHRDEFIAKFANEDTVAMPEDVRRGLRELYRRAFEKGLIDHEPVHEVI